jgi:drug/metabolite transporter (DMT)-like permease
MGEQAATIPTPTNAAARLGKLQGLGVLSGLAAGAWLGAAEAPTKLVTAGISPIVISLMMVAGVFLARWSVPALIRGTGSIASDIRQAPHLVAWAVLAGCLWSVANTLTIFAIRNIGLSIAFPLWNTNSLLGILWGYVFFNELSSAGWRRWLGVWGGAALMFAGAALLASASQTQAPAGHSLRGLLAALGAGVLWGTMYIPYRKAYLTGINPLTFVAFFTIGELGMMTGLAVAYSGGPAELVSALAASRGVLWLLMAGGFIWVIGDLFQQYAAKYVGISRGIPLSNSNQLWGMLWGILVFGELRGQGASVYTHVIGGSLLMAAGVGAIALASATASEHERWRAAAERESRRYGVRAEFTEAGLEGRETAESSRRRSWFDWLLVAAATAIFIIAAAAGTAPHMALAWGWAAALILAMLSLLAVTGVALWRTTRFN